MANLKQFRMGDFRGVDFSSSPLNASYTRAVVGKNWINEYGANKKRNGWEQILPKLGDKINGIFPYQVNDGMEMLVFTDKRAFRVYFANNEWASVDVSASAGTETYAAQRKANGDLKNLADRKLMAAYGKNGIYIPAGGYYFYSTSGHELYELDAYQIGMTAAKAYAAQPFITVPRTTINISPNGYAPTGETLDSVNLLTPYRINEFAGVSTEGATYTLDATPDETDYYFLVDGVAKDSTWFSISGNQLTSQYNQNGKTISVVFKRDLSITGPDCWDFSIATDQAVGQNPVCTTFGIAGYSDRIFLGGNKNNRVYFSEEDDYSYFPYNFTADIGTSATKISAFLRLSDNTLAIFKEQNGNDPAVYYMSGRRDVEYNDDGSVKKVTPVFSFSAGATTETAVNAFVTGTLLGDSIITSRHGVYAIALTENYATNTRTARERSRLINARLQNMDLSEAVSIVWRGKYYLAVGDEVFIADANFKWQPNDGEWWQYEWYYWDHVPVRVWAVVDDVLMFGTSDGRLCAFDDPDLYMDRQFEQTDEGDLTIEYTDDSDFTNDIVAYNDNALDNIVAEGLRFKFINNDLSNFMYICNVDRENNTFQLKRSIKDETPMSLGDGGTGGIGQFWTETPVTAEWRTPVFDMGTNTHRKTLLRLTISADNVLDGTLSFGYETRNNATTRAVKGIQYFTFDALDFGNFTLDLPFASSYTVRARERGFNYIQFYFKSESPTNCVVNDLTATYRIIAENKGVR